MTVELGELEWAIVAAQHRSLVRLRKPSMFANQR